MKKLVILDFDGTIADSFDFVVGFLERQLRRKHPLNEVERQAMRGMTMYQMAVHLGCPAWRLPLLFIVGRQTMGRVIYDVPLFDGMAKVIEELKAEGSTVAIISSNNSRNIRLFLKHHHLYDHVDAVYGGASFFGKARTIRRALQRRHLTANDAVSIGDESRDIIAAKAVGVACVAVAWGFDTPAILKKLQPNQLVEAPKDIITVLKKL